METGLLNFHDEEHFPVFCGENSQLVNESSIFDSFTDFNADASSWILNQSENDYSLNPVKTETPEDYQKTLLDWQQHLSNLQGRDSEDGKDDSFLLDPLGELPDIFEADLTPITGPPPPEEEEVPPPQPPPPAPKAEEVPSYKVAKREGLVLKLTKKKDNEDCDKYIVHMPIKQEFPESNLPEIKNIVFPEDITEKQTKISNQEIKIEPIDVDDLSPFELQEAVANIEMIQDDFSDFNPNVKYEFPGLPDLIEIGDQPLLLEPQPAEVAPVKIEANPPSPPSKETPLPQETSAKKPKKEKSHKSKRKRNVSKAPPNPPPPQIQIEEDYFSIQSEIMESENNAALDQVKSEPKSPQGSVEPQEKTTANDVSVEKPVDEEPPSSKCSKVEDDPNQPSGKSGVGSTPAVPPVLNNLITTKNVSSNCNNTPPVKKMCPALLPLKPTTKSILEALPKEVIDRIKASSLRNKKANTVAPDVAQKVHLEPKPALLKVPPVKFGENTKLEQSYYSASPSQQKSLSVPGQGDWDKRWDSKKDSGLESGDVSDSSEILERSRGKPSPSSSIPSAPEELSIKVENHASPEPGEIVEEEPKKKKLNLEEYRNRRKNVTPKSPVKRSNGWKIPLVNPAANKKNDADNDENKKANAEVQVEETKPQASKALNTERRSHPPIERSRRRSSSSSSSSVGKSRYRRRARSRRRRSRRRSYRSRSRSRNRSYTRSRSRSRCRSRSRSRSRSRCRSRSSSSSASSRSSWSRSRSRSRGRSKRRGRSRSPRRRSSPRYSSRSRSRRHSSYKRSEDWSPVEKLRQVEERRVIYVGRLEEGTTRVQLRERFIMFGPIVDISLHFREKGDNYGFVTFAYKGDAYEAVEHGNDYPYQPKFDICFGGRRAFCKQRYSDLDGASPQQAYSPHQQNLKAGDSFDKLLREAQKKLKKSTHV